MENTPNIQLQPTIGNNNMLEPNDIMKNILIMILAVVLIFSILGVNIFTEIGMLLQKIIDIIDPTLRRTLGDLGYATGSLINTSSDALADISKTGIDIANGTLNGVGDLFKKGSGRNLDSSINTGPNSGDNVAPDTSNSSIQKSPSKNQWCLVGDYEGRRGCIEIGNSDKCLSGQVFPNQKICLNPTLSQNRVP
jgi:hypothetical protein